MCWAAIASGEADCKCCDGYTTCPNSTVWEDGWREPDGVKSGGGMSYDEYREELYWLDQALAEGEISEEQYIWETTALDQMFFEGLEGQ